MEFYGDDRSRLHVHSIPATLAFRLGKGHKLFTGADDLPERKKKSRGAYARKFHLDLVTHYSPPAGAGTSTKPPPSTRQLQRQMAKRIQEGRA